MIEKTSFEKVTEKIQLYLSMRHNIENGGREIKDTDGEIVAFETGKVFLKDGDWYERQYAPMKDIFRDKRNIVSYLDYLSEVRKDQESVWKFLSWVYGEELAGKCPVRYTDIVPTGIVAETEMRVDPDFRDLTKAEIKALMAFSPKQLEAIKAFEKAGKALLENNIRLMYSNENYSLEYFNAEHTVDNRVGSIEDLSSEIPDEEYDADSVVDVTDFCKEADLPYGDYFSDGAFAIFKNTEK